MYTGNIKFYYVPSQTVDIQNQEHVLDLTFVILMCLSKSYKV